MPFASLEGLRQEMIRLGVVRLLFKVLSTNDNSKQQIYLGSGYDSLKMIPGGELHAEPGLSRKHGASPRQIIKSALDFWWLNDDGESVRAPHAQLILYPQYPEVRMSGFLKGCAASPGALMSSRTAGRILFLGITEGGRIFGWLEDAGSAIANEAMQWIETGEVHRLSPVFVEIPLQPAASSSRDILCYKLLEICQTGWIASFRLGAHGEYIPYGAVNGAGYTLEGMFGITPNGIPLPDFLDWELKACTTSRWPRLNESARITLMTPELTTGLYTRDLEQFRERYAISKGEGVFYFTGTRRAGEHREDDRLFLEVRGIVGGKIVDPAGAGIFLIDEQNGEIAAGWTATGLLEHWKHKHGHTAYVPCEKKNEDGNTFYRYSHVVRLGEGADFSLILQAIASGNIYHDPGVKFTRRLNGTWQTHRRNQFRTTAGKICNLYKRCEDVDLLASSG